MFNIDWCSFFWGGLALWLLGWLLDYLFGGRALGSLRGQLNETEGELGRVRGQLSDALGFKSKFSAADQELSGFRTRFADLSAKSESQAKEIQDYQLRIGKLDADVRELDRLRVQVGDWQTRFGALEAERNKLQGELEASKKVSADLSALQGRYTALEGERNTLTADINRLRGELDTAKKGSADYSALQLRFANLEKERNTFSADLGRLRGELDTARKAGSDLDLIQSRLRTIEAERNTLSEENITLKKLSEELRLKASQGDGSKARIADLEAELLGLRNQIHRYQQDLNLMGQNYASAQARISDFEAHYVRRTEAVRAVQVSAADDLLIIEGIGPKTNDALRAAGITTFAQLAASDEARLRSIMEGAGLKFTPSIKTWAKQAGYLVRGDQKGFEEYTAYLIAGQDPKDVEVVETHSTTVLSSVRRGLKPDDLTIIEGIGPKMNQALLAAGIDTFAELAASSEDRLRQVIEAAQMPFSPSLPTWAKQAEYLVRGDMEGFKQYTEHLIAGREPGKEGGNA
jgi:predicted flap endonuclease-1-like 5' DNA nuclease